MRARSAEDTLARIKPRIQEYGITRVASVTGLDVLGVPVWMAVRPMARSLTVSQGKGISDSLAYISAVMESIEMHHAEHWDATGPEVSLGEAFQDARFASPAALSLRSDAKVTDATTVAWVEGRDLVSGEARYLPKELLDLDFRMKRGRAPIFLSSSNGLASGNTRTEAVVHGLCEVIERDQSCLWQIEQSLAGDPRARMVKLETIEDPICRQQIETCRRANLDVWVWYCTYDIDVPVFACTIADRGNATFYPQRASGYGCHPVATVALSRAITEAIQSRLTHISGVRDDVTWERYRNDISTTDRSNLVAFEAMAKMQPALSFHDIPIARPPATMEAMLDEMLEKLRSVELTQAIVVDLPSRMDDFAFVFVCVPGLEFAANKPNYTPGARMLNFLSRLKKKAA
ncbi:YcaO-like family protein [Dongia sedimenti]|uniref:YcaO-like family protein n=1 Tax=Dongia sedimenti TaxID=3064282 RepID=A0ABU0YGK9_9PROT|nr:YcaO-like family protein [Rhodospirillaceae bacterium R-7]